MKNNFNEPIFREIKVNSEKSVSKIIKNHSVELSGTTRISVEEDEHQNIKLIIKKDGNDAIREITFVCSCGKTKSVMLDYSE